MAELDGLARALARIVAEGGACAPGSDLSGAPGGVSKTKTEPSTITHRDNADWPQTIRPGADAPPSATIRASARASPSSSAIAQAPDLGDHRLR